MKYSNWLIVNISFLLFFSLYLGIVGSEKSNFIFLSNLFSHLAILFFLMNLLMFFIISLIKKSNKRQVKKFFARFLRKYFKTHVPFAITGSSLILVHAVFNLSHTGLVLGYHHPKMISGYTALFLLTINLIAGYFRYHRASGSRRKFHLYSALLFTGVFFIHIFLN